MSILSDFAAIKETWTDGPLFCIIQHSNHSFIMGIIITLSDISSFLSTQLFSNAMVVAGLVEDPRTVLTTMNELLELALEKH